MYKRLDLFAVLHEWNYHCDEPFDNTSVFHPVDEDVEKDGDNMITGEGRDGFSFDIYSSLEEAIFKSGYLPEYFYKIDISELTPEEQENALSFYKKCLDEKFCDEFKKELEAKDKEKELLIDNCRGEIERICQSENIISYFDLLSYSYNNDKHTWIEVLKDTVFHINISAYLKNKKQSTHQKYQDTCIEAYNRYLQAREEYYKRNPDKI